MTSLAAAVSGLVLSLGPGHRVVGRLTFDPRKAAAGGYVLALPRPSAADEDAIRLSDALLTGPSGALGPAGVIARRHQVPALALERARWRPGALVISVPAFGPAVESGGVTVRPVTGFETRALAEGEVVGVDPADGLLLVFKPDQEAFELDLAQALRAFDGLRDLQALLQWYDARTASGPSPALAARLVEELAQRLAEGTATEPEFKRLRLAVDAGLDAQGRRATAEAAADAAQRQERALADRLDDLADDAGQAGAAAALERLSAQGAHARAQAEALAQAMGAAALAAPVEKAQRRLAEAARRRRARVAGRALGPAQALAAAGASLPASTTLPGSLYDRFVAGSGIGAELGRIQDDASLSLLLKAQRAAALFASVPLTPDSPVGRDALKALPAAQRLSLCGPEGCRDRVSADQVLPALRDVWAMSWSAGALGLRLRAAAPLVSPAVTAAVFVPADVSGLADSRDPVTGSPRRVVVACVAGEPDALAAGEAAGDEYTLEAGSLRELRPPELAGPRRCLTPDQERRVAAAARALDDALGEGVELTYAFSGGRLIARSWRELR